MSKEVKQAEDTQTTAGDVLFQKVYLPEFLKAAEAEGVIPQTEADLENMLKIAGMCRMHEAAQETQASNPLAKAAELLSVQTFGSDKSADLTGLAADPDVAAALATVSAPVAA